jgi:hypothetical protein
MAGQYSRMIECSSVTVQVCRYKLAVRINFGKEIRLSIITSSWPGSLILMTYEPIELMHNDVTRLGARAWNASLSSHRPGKFR